jgi:hypothetical protein
LVILQQKLLCQLDEHSEKATVDSAPQLKFRGGCTLVIDPVAGCARYAITKRVGDKDRPGGASPNDRLERVRAFLRGKLSELGDAALDRFPLIGNDLPDGGRPPVEPLRVVHRGRDLGE